MRTIPPDEFGQDHWSLLAYVGAACANLLGEHAEVDRSRLRCNVGRHPGLRTDRHAALLTWREVYSTRLKNGTESGHDDWDCLDDLEKAGYVSVGGTGIHPIVSLTSAGLREVVAINAHRKSGKRFADYTRMEFSPA